MERRLHPTHDRTTFRRAMLCFAAAMLSLVGSGAALAAGAGEWVIGLGGAGFLTATTLLVVTPVNSCRCPTCGEWLSRGADTTEFRCGRCGIEWYTRGYGWGVRG